MNVLKQHRDVITGVVIALIIGLLLGYGWGRQMGGAANMMMSSEVPAATSTSTTSAGATLLGSSSKPVSGTVAEGNSLTVANQSAGMSVKISSVMLSQEAWIAVRDSNGITLGAALFPAGTRADVSVPLLKPMQAGQNYQALIYFDDGSKTFSLKTETIVLNPDGSVAGATFNVQ